MPAGYEVKDANGNRAWWDGKKLTPLDSRGYAMKAPPRAANVDQSAFARAQDSAEAISDAEKRTNWFRTGLVGGITSGIPGSPAYNLDKDLDTLKARTAFEELSNMRKQSPTGGALGGIAVRELDLLTASEANLDVGQGEKQIDKNLGRMRRTLEGRYPGLTPDNPIDLTVENRAEIPQGAYFRVNGQVFRNKRGAGPANAIRTVRTPQEAAALPPGTKFRTPDGQVRVRR